MPQPSIFPVGPIRSITREATANSGTGSITVPSIVKSGDLVVICTVAYDTGTAMPALVTPAGYSIVIDQQFGGWGARLVVAARIVRSSAEAGDVLSVTSGSSATGSILQVFRARVPIKSATPRNFDSNISNGDPGPSTAAAAGVTIPALAFAIIGVDGAITPTFQTLSPAATFQASRNNVNVGTRFEAPALGAVPGTPTAQSVDCDDNGTSNFTAAFFLEVR
jgi:hypothetical protein